MKLTRQDQTVRLSPARMVPVAALAVLGSLGLPRWVMRPAKDLCVECGCQIPPGRGGRKCESCRSNPPPAAPQ